MKVKRVIHALKKAVLICIPIATFLGATYLIIAVRPAGGGYLGLLIFCVAVTVACVIINEEYVGYYRDSDFEDLLNADFFNNDLYTEYFNRLHKNSTEE